MTAIDPTTTTTTSPPPPAGVRRHVPCMGSVASVHVCDRVAPRTADAAVAAALAELERIEATFSTFDPRSVISRVNRGELDLLDAPAEVLAVLDACTWLEHVSGGAFRAHPPERPTSIDPAGYVKGWAIERAARYLAEAGLEHWYVGIGGDLQAHGGPAPGRDWRFGITDPRRADHVVAVLRVADAAVATSGTAQRGAHLWDGRTGARVVEGHRPSTTLASVTVTGPHLRWADAFATAAFAMGPDGVDWVAGFPGYHALAVTSAGEVVRDAGWAAARGDVAA